MNKKTDREKNENIQVFVRCRPLSALERKQNSYSVVDAIPEQKEIIVREKITEKFFSRTFAFDKVFGPKASQLEVHKMVVGPLIKEVLMGYNCTVFAYGQTGTGKTFTMEGERSNEIYKWEEDPLAGIIPRTLQQIFEELKSLNIEFTVRVSFLELYNEEIFDLLGPSEDSSKLRLFDDTSRKGSVVIQGLEEITLRSKNDIYYILEKGSAKRHKAATLLNASSSRSHTVFSVTVHIKENSLDGEDLLKIGKLNLVDLAGSENIGRSGAVDRTAREAGNINQSLLTLGRVITALVERAPHIPYRESKLTRLLQDSLGGRTKTSIIATVSPAHSNIEETLNTLDYAYRAKNITNKPEVNQKLSKQALLKEYTEEIRKLHKDLEVARRKNGIFVDEENYNQMQLELSTKSDEIRQTVAEIEVLKEQIEKVNELFCSTKVDLDKITKELEHQKLETSEKSQELQERTKELTHTRKALDTISLQHDEQQHLVYHHVKNEKKLSAQGQKLKATADRTTTDLKALHEKLERKRTIEKLNDEQSYKFRVNLQQHMGEMEDSITQMWQQQSEYVNNMQSILGSGVELFHRQMTALSNVMSTLISSHSGLLGTLSSQLNHQGKVEQQWAGDTIKTVAQKKEMATSNHRTFLSEQFIPLMNVMQMLIQSQAATVQDHGKLLHSKLEQQESSIKFHLEEQKDALLQLKKNIQLFSSEQRNGLEVCQQHVARGIQFESELNKEWEEQINIIQKAISSVKQIMEKHHSQVTQEVPVIQKQLEDVSRSSQENKIKIDSNAKTLSSMLENFETSFIADTKDLAASSVENLFKVKETIHDIKEKHETLKSDILEFGHHSELTWEQNYQTMESIVRLHAETEIQDLQDNQYCIQELATAMRAAAEQHDSLLELHKLEFEAQAAAQKSVISNMKDSNSIWSQEFSARIWQRDKEMENYLYEEMLKDQPTGQTPERKEYVYSKDLVKTTPDDKVLQRLRAIIYPSEKLVYSIPDSSFSEGDISSDFDDDMHQVKPEFTNEFSSGELSLTEVLDDTENKEDKENIVYTSVVAKHLSPPTPKTTSSPSPIKPLRANNIV